MRETSNNLAQVWNRTAVRALLPLALGLGLVITLFSSLRETSVTVDEFAHLPAGLSYWDTGEFSVYRHNPPLLRLIAAAPLALSGVRAPDFVEPPNRWALGTQFMRENSGEYHAHFMMARTAIIALTCLTALLLFLFTRATLGYWPGIVALTLFCTSPTVLAHGGLVTTDAGFALACFGSFIAAVTMLKRPTLMAVVVAGTVLGLAQLTKFTAVLLYPLLGAIFVGLPFLRSWGMLRELGWLQLSWTGRLGRMMAGLFVSVVVLNAGYLFHGTGSSLSELGPTHPTVQSIAASPVGSIPTPLPSDYIKGFDEQLVEASGIFPVYLLGQVSTEGWWYYYPVVLLVKLPLPLLLLFGALLALVLRRRLKTTPLLAASIAIPTLAFLFFTVLTNINLGVRYFLFILPFLHFAIAHLAIGTVSARRRWLLVGCLAWYVGSSLGTHPHYISYFNEAAGRAGNGHRILADSNLDWGQDLIRLKTFLNELDMDSAVVSNFGLVDPAVYGIAPLAEVEPGSPYVVAISINHLLGIHPWGRPGQIDLYRDREPDARVGHSLWIFFERGRGEL